jgi:acetyl/propionyl-CoA carboxylase alpha subunit
MANTFTAKVNNNEFKVDIDNNEFTVNGNKLLLDITKEKENSWHALLSHKSYNVELVKVDEVEKLVTLKVNGNKYQVSVKDKFDALLKSLGMENLNSVKVNELKAPMPGLVIDIRVNEGDEVKKGDPLLVLEAMKMENILKCPADVKIKKININKSQAVEKNQVLISFE